MSERGYIYPTCPNCGNKASRDNPVTLAQVTQPPWEWTCPDCQTIHLCRFGVRTYDRVQYLDSWPTRKRRVVEGLKLIANKLRV